MSLECPANRFRLEVLLQAVAIVNANWNFGFGDKGSAKTHGDRKDLGGKPEIDVVAREHQQAQQHGKETNGVGDATQELG